MKGHRQARALSTRIERSGRDLVGGPGGTEVAARFGRRWPLGIDQGQRTSHESDATGSTTAVAARALTRGVVARNLMSQSYLTVRQRERAVGHGGITARRRRPSAARHAAVFGDDQYFRAQKARHHKVMLADEHVPQVRIELKGALGD